MFNLNNQLFLCLHVTVEVDNLGKFTLDQRYFTVNLDAYDLSKTSTYFKLALQGYVAFWVLFYLVEEAKQMRESGFRSYFAECAFPPFTNCSTLQLTLLQCGTVSMS